jgi:hypothetical protein
MAENERDMFGYGTGYVPQMDKILDKFERELPDFILDRLMDEVIADAKSQGIDLNDDSDDERFDDAQDLLHETLGDAMHTFVEHVRKAAASDDPDELHFILMPF